MKIVLDTNVLLSGVLARGICEAVLDECFGSPECEVVLCEHILHEFTKKAETKFDVPPQEARQAAEILRNHVQIVRPADIPAHSCRDKQDLPVLGTALAAKADYLVTGDKDLLVLKKFHSTVILDPRAFYDRLKR